MDFYYPRTLIAMAELQFDVEWIDTLGSTAWSKVGVTETILSNDGVIEMIKAHVPTGGNDHRFIHLRVTKPQ